MVDGIGPAGGELDGETSSRIRRSMGGGRALDPSLRSTMEGAFAADLSGVRVHADTSSARIARSMNAEAFTLGRDVYFADGAYAPDTPQGVQTVAHELAHVVDGGSGTVTRRVVHRRFAYKAADLDRTAPKRSVLQKMSMKKDPVAPLRKVLTGYEKIPTFVDELWWINQIIQASQGFLDAFRDNPTYASVVAVVEDIWFAAMADAAKLRAKANYLRDARAGADLQGYDPRNPYQKKPDVPANALPLQHQAAGAKAFVTSPARDLAQGKANAPANTGADATTLELMKKYGLDEADIVAIRAYSNEDFKYINPAVENQSYSKDTLDSLVDGDGRIKAKMDLAQSDDDRLNAKSAGGMWHEPDKAKRGAKVAGMQAEGRAQGGMLTAALQRMEPVPGTYLRGLSLNEAKLRQRFGSTVTWGTFTSMTVKPSVATAFADGDKSPFDRSVDDLHVILVIHTSQAYDIQSVSVQGDKEGEFLLLPGACLKVDKIERQATPFPETTKAVIPDRRKGVREYVRITLTQLSSEESAKIRSDKAIAEATAMRADAAPAVAAHAAWSATGGQVRTRRRR